MTLTKQDLIKDVSQKTWLSSDVSEFLIGTLFKWAKSKSVSGNDLAISRLGKFHLLEDIP